MQTNNIDALRLWWREINFTQNQRRALAAVAVLAIGLSAFLIFKPHKAEAIAPPLTTIAAPPLLVVDVQGEVLKPGVYELAINARVNDAIKAAGGATNSADLSFINQARLLKDGEQIFVERKTSVNNSARSTSRSSSAISGILNINRASAKELDKLPGIGPVIASRIIEYRSANGFFQAIEDLKKVQGIGNATLEKFRSKIRV
jgi:competence protein ComEA